MEAVLPETTFLCSFLIDGIGRDMTGQILVKCGVKKCNRLCVRQRFEARAYNRQRSSIVSVQIEQFDQGDTRGIEWRSQRSKARQCLYVMVRLL